MTKPDFNAGDRVSWKYGAGKGTGHIIEKLTKATKLYGKNFKATAEEPKYKIKSDKGKELIRNPETLEMLLDAAGETEGAEKEEVGGDKDEEIEDAEGDEKEDDTEVDKEQEVGGQPLQQMPESETKCDMNEGKSIPYLENADEDASLSKSEVRYEPDRKLHDAANSGDENDVKMEEAKGEENGTDKTHSVHSSPCEEVPQPGLDSVK